MFPLKVRKIGGYVFGQRAWYTAHHLGTDYVASKGTPLFAPFDGYIVSQTKGVQGGNTILFKPDGQDVVIRFMHLNDFVTRGGKVKKGALVAHTGNTGVMTTGAHLHIDISKHSLNIYNFSNFLDPKKFDWKRYDNKRT